ncbi:pseudouridylate synthase, 23S RNA-specific [Lachnospiraceae bacterium TWA4]|nr:pseudouridylate synthase, 23S RNA-specific [Lachnospiraceae bacterium TWA4]
MEAENIMIREAIIHILDRSSGLPVLSDCLLEYDEDCYEYIRKQLVKLLTSDDKRECTFDAEHSGFYNALQLFDEDNLIGFSQQIAEYFYQVMSENEEIPGGDLIVATCQLHSEQYLAILKLNYREDFTHLTRSTENGNANHMIRHRALLPSASSKPTEAAIIKLSDYTIYLTEKKYSINGKKGYYLSELVLQCRTKISENDKMKLLTKAVEQINKKHFEENFDKKLEVKDSISEELISDEPVDVMELPKKLYADYPNAQMEFQEKMEEYDLMKEKIHPENPNTVKKFEKQFLTTDSGIEITIPMDIYRDKHKVEFVTDVDGSIQIVIKNIQQLFTK